MNNNNVSIIFSDKPLSLCVETSIGEGRTYYAKDVPVHPIMEVRDQGLVEFDVQSCFNISKWGLENVETVGMNLFKIFNMGWLNLILYPRLSKDMVSGLYALPVSISDRAIYPLDDLITREKYGSILNGAIGTLSIRKDATSFASENDAILHSKGKNGEFYHLFRTGGTVVPVLHEEVKAVFVSEESVEEEGDSNPDFGKYGDSQSIIEVQNRFTYHPPEGDQKERYEELTAKTRELAVLFVKHCPPGMQREFALMLLSQARTQANTVIATYEDPKPLPENT